MFKSCQSYIKFSYLISSNIFMESDADQGKRLDFHVHQETEASNSKIAKNENSSSRNPLPPLKSYKLWFQMAIYSLLILIGQSAATLLGRLYYEKGGKSKYIAALVQSAGFPILFPLIYITSKTKTHTIDKPKPSLESAKYVLYLAFGTILAFICLLYAIGLKYLPVSTYSLICSTQLGFNALFSFFINSQKITPSILNSILLLTISTILLVLDSDSSSSFTNGKYTIGFISTLSGSFGYALLLSFQQLGYGKVLRNQNLNAFLKVIFFESMVTSIALLICLFASGEWKDLKKEVEGFELGSRLYVVILLLTGLSWQVFAVGMLALILKVSSLFGNVISTMSVPIVPVLAVVFFQDEMSGVKVVAMLLAIWGFVSYVYQQYVDSVKLKRQNAHQVMETFLSV